MREWETRHDLPIGIYSETDTLKGVAIWGALSVEAVLAQFYPTNISLFFGEMDVLKARKESQRFAEMLQGNGVRVVEVRDEFAKLLPRQTLDKWEVISTLFTKAEDTLERFGIPKPGYKEIIVELIEQDIARYGQDQALAINKALCLDTELPMGNLIYARDQMNVLLGTRFQSSMTKSIRKPEVAVYETVYQQALGLPKPVVMPDGETFEGGDAYIHDGIVYVGVGARSTLGSAIHIFKSLQAGLEALGFGFAVVYDADVYQRSEKDQMDFMHLDTFSMPLSRMKILLCAEEARRRKVLTISQNHGSLQVTETNLSFMDFLEKQAQDIHIIPLEEQQFFGCNFLNLDAARLIMPVESNSITNGMLKGANKESILADLSESTKGYGGAHCMSGQLWRSTSL